MARKSKGSKTPLTGQQASALAKGQWIAKRRWQIIAQKTKAALETGRFETEKEARKYFREEVDPFETRTTKSGKPLTVASREAKEDYDRLKDVFVKWEDLPEHITYETVKDQTDLVNGNHDSSSFYYKYIHSNDDILNMADSVYGASAWEECSNISGPDARKEAAAFLKEDEIYYEECDCYIREKTYERLIDDGVSVDDINAIIMQQKA